MKYNFKTTNNPLLFGLAMVAGIGLVLMIIALGAGVTTDTQGGDGLLFVFLVGLAMLVIGVGAWVVVVQPFRHFDDINQPLDDGHGHSHSTAVVPHDEGAGHALDTSAGAHSSH